MDLQVIRRHYSNACTIGELSLNNRHFSYTLEDIVRPTGTPKVHGKTAIPAGRYQVVMSISPRFGKRLPLLMHVPGFEGVRIHNGNNANHTEGCLLVGYHKGPNVIFRSKAATKDLVAALEECVKKKEPIYITIVDTNKTQFTPGIRAGGPAV